eukprot:5496281-Prymnesium_polylepis.1
MLVSETRRAAACGSVRQRAAACGSVHGACAARAWRHLDELAFVREPRLGAQRVAAVDLVLVEGDAGDARFGEAAEVAQRPADAAAAVEHQLVRLDAQPQCEVVLMPLDGRRERLARELVGKVEGLAPALCRHGERG